MALPKKNKEKNQLLQKTSNKPRLSKPLSVAMAAARAATKDAFEAGKAGSRCGDLVLNF